MNKTTIEYVVIKEKKCSFQYICYLISFILTVFALIYDAFNNFLFNNNFDITKTIVSCIILLILECLVLLDKKLQ